MRRSGMLLLCVGLFALGCGGTASDGADETGSQSTGGTPEGGESGVTLEGGESVVGGEAVFDLCADLNCDDGQDCTIDSCDTGQCQHEPRTGEACDDGNACTLGDACSDKGLCESDGSALCDDGNGCTIDDCNMATGCVFVPMSGPLYENVQ